MMLASTAKSDLNLVGDSVIDAAEVLGLNREQLASAIGVSVPTIARMKKGAPIPGHKPFEMALLVIRIYRALYAIVGGDKEAMQHWMGTPNKHFCEQSGLPQVPGPTHDPLNQAIRRGPTHHPQSSVEILTLLLWVSQIKHQVKALNQNCGCEKSSIFATEPYILLSGSYDLSDPSLAHFGGSRFTPCSRYRISQRGMWYYAVMLKILFFKLNTFASLTAKPACHAI